MWAAIFSASMLALRAYGDSTGPVPASSLFAGQASYINNADTLPVGQIVAEEDLTYTHNSQSDYFEYPITFTCGLLPRWDFSASFGGQWQSYSDASTGRVTVAGFSDIPVDTKVKLLDEGQFWCSQSIELKVKFPVASQSRGLSTGYLDYDPTWVVSKGFTSKLTGDFNLGYTWLGNSPPPSFFQQLHYGVAVEYTATDRLGLLAQVLVSVPGSRLASTEVALTAGIGWQITPRLQVHGSVTKGIGAGSRIINFSTTIGATWTFGKLPTPAGKPAAP